MEEGASARPAACSLCLLRESAQVLLPLAEHGQLSSQRCRLKPLDPPAPSEQVSPGFSHVHPYICTDRCPARATFPCRPTFGSELGASTHAPCLLGAWKVNVRLPEKEESNPRGARPVHPIISMIKWIRTNRLSIKNSHSFTREHAQCQ